MSELATTWPPSCHAALLWSTLTPRMSLSLMKETGWNDGGQVDVGGSSGGRRGQTCSAAPQTLHSTPRHQTLLSTGKRKETLLLPSFPLSSSFISSYRCLVVICVWRRVSTSPSPVSLVFQDKFFAFIHFCTTKQTCFRWISCDKIPTVCYYYT